MQKALSRHPGAKEEEEAQTTQLNLEPGSIVSFRDRQLERTGFLPGKVAQMSVSYEVNA